MNKLDPFEKIISKKLNDHQVDFSYDSWDAIEKKLPKSKPNYFLFVSVGIILISASLFYILQDSEKSVYNSYNLKEANKETTTITASPSESNDKSEKVTAIKNIPSKPIKSTLVTTTKDSAEDTTEISSHQYVKVQNHAINPPNINNGITAEPKPIPTSFDSSIILVNDPAIAEFSYSQSIVCAFDSVQFKSLETENMTYFWDFDDGNSSTAASPLHHFSESGSFDVSLTITNKQSGISATKTVKIDVFENNEANFNFEHTVDQGIPSVSFTPFISRGSSLDWNFGDGSSSSAIECSHRYNKKGLYFVTLQQVNQNNCISTVTKPIEILNDFNLFAPNSFTPDGDGVNDTFIPESLKLMNVDFTMNIYNKQGKLIFKTKNINQPWNGMNQNTGQKCHQGSYVWVVQLVNKNGEPEQYNGALLLLN